MKVFGDVLVNGIAVAPDQASVSVLDVAFLRGYGCFEAMRSYDGKLFRMAEHLNRLEASAGAMWIPLPDRADLEAWAIDRAALGDAVVRIVVTGGLDLDRAGTGASVVVFAHDAPPRPDALRLLELDAPWHPAGEPSELAGVKSTSYGPNVAAVQRAKQEGFDDAVLLDNETTVLELPNATIGWVVDGVVETPSLDLGILRSVTRHAMLEVAAEHAIHVEEGRFPAARLHAADEAFVMSTTKEIVPVTAVGSRQYEPGPVTKSLADGFRDLVQFETGG